MEPKTHAEKNIYVADKDMCNVHIMSYKCGFKMLIKFSQLFQQYLVETGIRGE